MESDLFVSYIALLTHAVIPIIVGSFQSLVPSQTESLEVKDAAMFPVIGSCVLFSLYLCFKFLSDVWVNFVMSAYFTFLGIGAIATALHPVLSAIMPHHMTEKSKEGAEKYRYKITIPVVNWNFEFSLVDIIGGVIGSIVGIFYIITKHWIANNLFGECFSMVSIQLIQLGSYKIGSVLLIGLFFYDIFWVFGTDVMVTVAKKFDAPIKVVWPKGAGFSLLGLGDIVIPGIFVALMLRFDYYLYKKYKTGVFAKTYFIITFISYVIGLVLTIAVLHIFRAGQPALLYIVPCVLGGSFLTAVFKGQVSELLGYHDDKLLELEYPELAEKKKQEQAAAKEEKQE
ncbi:peptidase A22B family protein [Naegleria gruberi]|uniref:Peptidase A22B family protein n=1 Tax=Naegleria gruberi TaxID=5762 RepID=D2UZX7_NAEGR|nr:peptidase A22B family protein [Naegleria gruberi]EFC50012.1 peptidase A22B family protein [Naegleria gruberi]|eukprot:XP_002682756.1 peptidase A22B family protein [Naegleria gruberi strain NEG-M]